MGRKFEAEVQQHATMTLVRLAGTLDEDNELLPVAGHVRSDVAVIDLSGISEVNKFGVRDWVRWLDEVSEKTTEIVLVECSPAIVAQLNQVSNFAGSAYVRSFYVPYFCQACDTERAMLIDMNELMGAKVRAPTCRCDSCDGVMEFDDLEESYFAFVAAVRRRIPESLSEKLDALVPGGGERKVLSHAAESSFVGIPSNPTTGVGATTSVPSAAALRRLRDKTGLRTMRRADDATGGETRKASRRRLLVIAATALALALAVTIAAIAI